MTTSDSDKPVIFNKYQLEERIGSGGMAEVYKAISLGARGFKRPVVIKRILPNLARDKHFVDMFVREASISASLDHPNIVRIYDLGEYRGNLFMVLEYIEGTDLGTLIYKLNKLGQPFPPPLVAYMAIDICKALECAHEHKDFDGKLAPVIHRDISPQNILISKDGVTKLADFGLALCLGMARLTRKGIIKGKFGYMSPEQARGKQDIDHRTDIFSLGIVLWEALTGQRLFYSNTPEATILKVRECNIVELREIAPHVPEELANIVHKALKKNPEERYNNARDMRLALQNYLRKINPPVDNRSLAKLLNTVFGIDALKNSIAEPTLSLSYDDLIVEDFKSTCRLASKTVEQPLDITEIDKQPFEESVIPLRQRKKALRSYLIWIHLKPRYLKLKRL